METYSSTQGSKEEEGKESNWLKRSTSPSANNMKYDKQAETALVLAYLPKYEQIAVGTKNGFLKLFCPLTLK